MAIKNGNFVIRNSGGVVTLGAASAMTNDTKSASFGDETPLVEHPDALNVTRAFTEDQRIYSLRLALIPGTGTAAASKAATLALVGALRKMDAIVTSGFDDADLNWASGVYGFVYEVGKTFQMGDDWAVEVTARRICSVTASGGVVTETPVQFTAWAQI